MAYPEDYPDDLTKAKQQGYLHKHMRVLVDGTTGYPVYNPSTALGPDLLAWWDASHTSRIIGSPGVSTWLDAVAGYNMVQATPASQPVYSATSFGGAPGLSFDGVAQCLALESVPFPTGAAPSEIWGLAQQNALVADATGRTVFSYGGNTSATAVTRILQRIVTGGANRGRGIAGDGAGSNTSTNTAVDFSSRHAMRFQIGATELTVTVDGTTSPIVSAVPATGTVRCRIGASTINTPGLFWQGVIAAVLVTSPLSAAKRRHCMAG